MKSYVHGGLGELHWVGMLVTKDAGAGSKDWRNELGPGHVRPPEPSGV